MKNILFIFILFFTISCEKSDKDPFLPVIAGSVNEDMFFRALDPEIIIDISWTQCGYGIGEDSIDFNQDGDFDLFFDVQFLDQELFWSPECCPPYLDCWPNSVEFSIYGSQNTYIASYYELWDEIYFWDYADTIPEGFRIDTITKWENGTMLWSETTPVSDGAWYKLNKTMYLGIRFGDSTNYKYGWIEVIGSVDNNPIFKSYAIENE
jgi:hypothetical protein